MAARHHSCPGDDAAGKNGDITDVVVERILLTTKKSALLELELEERRALRELAEVGV